ncbi:DUF116 domain-containing protein [Desulfotruncus alcoholivorax]|uniref:DUF116 domain-containing protein n=1 Tax=Desulfotruncus alcoholivorax TaxID=265477 RepID=UPI000420A2FD|nr:DUF116 domain-containing protein [Desulfotruncus alcoholivorax]
MDNLVRMHERKRLYIGLLGASLLIVSMLTVAIWYLVFSPEKSVVYRLVLLALAAVLIIAILLAGFGLAGIVLTIIQSRQFSILQGPMRVALNTFFPLALALGKIFRIDMDRIKGSFIEVNNGLVNARGVKIEPAQLLLLVPHCLQNSECDIKVTNNIDNCRRCGKCGVNEILNLRDRYGIKVGMATGGTLARKYVREYRPKAIVAIACERDLTSGILDANPIPVLGITNLRPNGPCFNTHFSPDRLDDAIKFFVRSGCDGS